ncbi:MAG: hypothetical protein R3F34_15640 [Planctomycetota bacterium]
MQRPWTLAWLVASLLLLAVPAHAQDVGKLHREQLEKAKGLAAWADERDFFTGRDAIYRIVVVLDPSDEDARKALGYKKKKGEWVEGKYKEPTDKCEEGVPAEFADLRAAAYAELLAHVTAEFADVKSTPAANGVRMREYARLLPWSPDDPELHAFLGETYDPERSRWILLESAAAIADRAARVELLEKMREKLPEATPCNPDEYARKMNIEFPVCVESRNVNCTSTVDEEETRALLDISHMMRDYFAAVFPRAGKPGYPTVIYVLDGGNLRRAFFSQHPLCKPDDLEWRVPLTSSWLQGRLVVSAESKVLRKDVTTFQTCGYALTEKYGVWVEDGWAQQGLCSYLSYNVCGTRLSFWQISEDRYGGFKNKDWTDRVPPTTDGWLSEARRLVDEGQPMGKWVRALAIHTSQMDWQDVVMSHALAAYLFEGRRPELIAILERLKKAKQAETPMTTVFEEELGLTVQDLRDRVMRWIGEVAEI